MSRRGPIAAAFLLAVFSLVGPASARGEALLPIDDFETVDAWSAHPADGVELAISGDEGFAGRGMRLDFAFTGGGYAVARRAVDLDLPENYAFTFMLRGEAPVNHLEFKLIDDTGENVWWSVRRDMEFPGTWTPVRIKKRQISFAWGPQGGGEIRHAAAIEIVVTAGSGGAGSVWIDELVLQPLPPPGSAPPIPQPIASSQDPGHRPGAMLDADRHTWWEPAEDDPDPWVGVDFGRLHEYGGLLLDWRGGFHAADYAVEISDDGESWRTIRRVRGSNGGRDYLYLPETESRMLRARFRDDASDAPDGNGRAGITGFHVQPLAWAASREAFFEAVARDAPRGAFPRSFSGEQLYWTVVGQDRDTKESLLSEDGALELAAGDCSIEPFLLVGGRILTWADVSIDRFLDDGYLPIPTVRWKAGDIELLVTAFSSGPPETSATVLQYRVVNGGPERTTVVLLAAVRPFQVNPPSQTLNRRGGVARVRDLSFEGAALRVNGDVRVWAFTPPAGAGAVSFDGGDGLFLVDGLRLGASSVHDPFEAASGVLGYSMTLDPGAEESIVLAVPLHPEAVVSEPGSVDPAVWAEVEKYRAREAWSEKLQGPRIEVPEAGREIVETLRAQIAWVLVNRAGPAIQPGTRSYARSWIRDGALTSAALLRYGLDGPVREFLEWFGPHQYANGKIPCVVDHRGADPVPEHDSTGEFIHLATEYYRYTGDREAAERWWPAVLRGVAYLDSLRRETRVSENLVPERRMFYGLLPPSISHEGYSAKPMHSYWDDFFALLGFRDAVFLAAELGEEGERMRIAGILAEFEEDLAVSVERAMDFHGIDYVPGCADLGDFDATSTTVALDPTGAATILPRPALERTFERYYTFFTERRDGAPWEAFTPYEVRNIGAFTRLGWRDRAQELIRFFMDWRRPEGWPQWTEVVFSDERTPHFIGDLPHSWVGTDFVRSVLDGFVYERADRRVLVLGAGIPAAWLDDPAGVTVEGIRTPYGGVGYTMRRTGETIEVRVSGGLRIPAEGILLAPPLHASRAETDGRAAEVDAEGRVILREVPATVRLYP